MIELISVIAALLALGLLIGGLIWRAHRNELQEQQAVSIERRMEQARICSQWLKEQRITGDVYRRLMVDVALGRSKI